MQYVFWEGSFDWNRLNDNNAPDQIHSTSPIVLPPPPGIFVPASGWASGDDSALLKSNDNIPTHLSGDKSALDNNAPAHGLAMPKPP